jgi:Spy/CpxP family protein refolding chaperone
MKEFSTRRKAALWVGGIFLLGGALGGVLGSLFARYPVSAANPPMTEQARQVRRVEQLTGELNLTDSQKQQLHAILTKVRAEITAIREQTDLQRDQARQKGRNQIRAILTPEQKPKFEDLITRIDEERKRNAASHPR